MEINDVKDKIAIIECLLKQANSRLEKLVLIRMREELLPLLVSFPVYITELKGGNEKNGNYHCSY